MSGSSCATTGCRTVYSNPIPISSITAASHGTTSPISHGASCHSVCAIGRTGLHHRVLVLQPGRIRERRRLAPGNTLPCLRSSGGGRPREPVRLALRPGSKTRSGLTCNLLSLNECSAEGLRADHHLWETSVLSHALIDQEQTPESL